MSKRAGINGGYNFREFERGEGGATVKGLLTDTSYRVGECEGSEADASPKRAVTNACHRTEDGDGG